MKHLKTYIRLILEEEEKSDKKSEEALVEDLLNMFSNKIKKERFKKIGLSLLKIGSSTILNAVEGIDAISDIVDDNGVMKDEAAKLIQSATSRLGLDKFIARFAEKRKPKEKDMLNVDPFYSKIVDNKVEKAFIIFYKNKLMKNRNKKLSEFIATEGDISDTFQQYLKDNYEGRTISGAK